MITRLSINTDKCLVAMIVNVITTLQKQKSFKTNFLLVIQLTKFAEGDFVQTATNPV